MTLEVEDYHFVVDNPDSGPIVTNDLDRNAIIESYTEKEMQLYLGGSDKALDYAAASSFWKNIANPDGTINSAYGHLIWDQRSCGWPEWHLMGVNPKDCDWMTPWNWAYRSLIADKDTRQAYLRFSLPRHQWFGNKDQVCTMHGIFLIRNDRLNFSIVMRSNDLVKGLVYDLPFFVLLMHKMRDALADKYQNLQVGQYRHLSHSMHIYESDVPKVRKMIGLGD